MWVVPSPLRDVSASPAPSASSSPAPASAAGSPPASSSASSPQAVSMPPRSTSVYSRSSSETSYRRARDMRLSVSGEDSEHSHLETACRETPSFSASSSCVRPAARRRSASRFAISTSMRVLSPASMISHVRREKLRESGWLRQRFWLEIRAIIGCAHASERGFAQFESHGAKGAARKMCQSAHDVTRHRGGEDGSHLGA